VVCAGHGPSEGTASRSGGVAGSRGRACLRQPEHVGPSSPLGSPRTLTRVQATVRVDLPLETPLEPLPGGPGHRLSAVPGARRQATDAAPGGAIRPRQRRGSPCAANRGVGQVVRVFAHAIQQPTNTANNRSTVKSPTTRPRTANGRPRPAAEAVRRSPHRRAAEGAINRLAMATLATRTPTDCSPSRPQRSAKRWLRPIDAAGRARGASARRDGDKAVRCREGSRLPHDKRSLPRVQAHSVRDSVQHISRSLPSGRSSSWISADPRLRTGGSLARATLRGAVSGRETAPVAVGALA
jgi:hypothetical protein